MTTRGDAPTVAVPALLDEPMTACRLMMWCTALLSAPLLPQAPATPAAYERLVDVYRDNDAAAARRVLSLSSDDIEHAVGNAQASGSSTLVDLKAAAMLHTDAAVALLRDHDAPAAFGQLHFATRLLDSVLDRDPKQRHYVRRWYMLVAQMLLVADAPAYVQEFQKRAAARVPDDPAQRRVENGRRLELSAANAGPTSRSGWVAPGRAGEGRAVNYLLAAQAQYRQALNLHPGLHEAWLRLGRVTMLLGSHADAAAAAFEQAEPSPDPRTVYLARLYRGALAERLDKFDEAERHYRSAIDGFKWGQSAPIALAQLLSRTSREAEAREIISAHLSRTNGRVVDPLWTYLFDPEKELRASLDELRAEVWR